jgi:hypothetical protein
LPSFWLRTRTSTNSNSLWVLDGKREENTKIGKKLMKTTKWEDQKERR